MLLTLAIRSLRTLLSKDGAGRLTLLEVPEFATPTMMAAPP